MLERHGADARRRATPYDDLENVSALTNLPDSAFHRNVDKVVLEAGMAHPDVVKTAIVCPPTIYGPGRRPGNLRSRQVYTLANATLKSGKASQLGTGLTEWDNVHVHDLSDLLVLLVEAAVANKPEIANELWGEKGYFLTESGYHVWCVVAKQVADAAYRAGYILDTVCARHDSACCYRCANVRRKVPHRSRYFCRVPIRLISGIKRLLETPFASCILISCTQLPVPII
jgi:hypothetical protein